MALLESFRIALEAIWANKLRALLTMLGVIIGVSSVIIMISMVQGLRSKIVSQFSSNGADLVFTAYDPKPGVKPRGAIAGITMKDVDEVSRRCSLVAGVSPSVNAGTTAHVGRKTSDATIVGVTTDYASLHNLIMASGRFLSDDDDPMGTTCVIGDTVRKDLFGNADAIGQHIICDSPGGNATVELTVIGVVAEKDRGGFGEDINKAIVAPIRAVQMRVTGSDSIEYFVSRASDVDQTEAAADQIWAVMKERHPLNYKDYIVDTQEGLLKQIDVVIGVIQLALSGIAGLSLLTGGIGIMNIMLVSVTERTREIGIRKAVGATSGAILMQFVIEAIVVSAIGGMIGTGIGYGTAAMINHGSKGQLPAFVPIQAVFLGVGFSAAVGLFFGIFPAFRASNMDPIQALRSE